MQHLINLKGKTMNGIENPTCERCKTKMWGEKPECFCDYGVKRV